LQYGQHAPREEQHDCEVTGERVWQGQG